MLYHKSFRIFFFFFLVLKQALHRIVKRCWFENKDQSSFLLAFCPQYYQLWMLCTLSGVVFVKHSAPGIFSVFFSFLMALRRQPVTRRWEQRRAYMKVSTVRLQGLPLGQRQEGREWEDLPESERCGCRKGQRVGRGWRAQAALWCVLLPASQILQDSVNLFFFAESLKERQQVQQLCVIHIVKPGLDWDLRKRENHLQLAFI